MHWCVKAARGFPVCRNSQKSPEIGYTACRKNRLNANEKCFRLTFRVYPNRIWFPDNDAERKMQHRFVVFDLFHTAAQNSTKAIHPAMRSFYNSTMSPEVSIFNRLRFFFPGLGMRFIATCFQTGFQLFLCPSTDLACAPTSLSEAHWVYLKLVLYRGYSPLKQPARVVTHSYRSSNCA